VESRTIGSLSVSLVGLGCNNFGRRIDAEQTDRVVDAALEHGITLFDTADVYGGDGRSEELLGRALGSRRDEAVVATKFGMKLDEQRHGAHPDYVRRACEDSLRRLGTDRIDLYQLHAPDPEVPIAETLGALDELVRAGKVVEIGNSNFSGGQLDEAEQAARVAGGARFVAAQNHWSVLSRGVEEDVVPAAERNGLGILPYFPLASGLLTGKYRAGEDPEPSWRIAQMPEERRGKLLREERLRKVAALEQVAGGHGRSLLELAVSWLAVRPVVASVIAGATRPEQVAANVAAADWELDDETLAAVDEITG
jgi:aryl-alcohol dehydrogenase-like predicted oxidoreductase